MTSPWKMYQQSIQAFHNDGITYCDCVVHVYPRVYLENMSLKKKKVFHCIISIKSKSQFQEILVL